MVSYCGQMSSSQKALWVLQTEHDEVCAFFLGGLQNSLRGQPLEHNGPWFAPKLCIFSDKTTQPL